MRRRRRGFHSRWWQCINDSFLFFSLKLLCVRDGGGGGSRACLV